MTRNTASTALKKPSPVRDVASPPSEAIARLASDAAVPVASHVHDLQDLLAHRLEQTAPARWSMRATLGFVALTCGGFWIGVFLAVRLLLR